MSFGFWICIHLLLRSTVVARGEEGWSALWDSELASDGKLLLHLCVVPHWSVVGHWSVMPMEGIFRRH
jgi:hypothetical protein